MNTTSYSVFNALVDIVASPGKALDEAKLHTSWLWWPLLISILLGCGLFYYYYNWVDFPWLVEETIRALPADSRAESADGVRQFMNPATTMWTTIGSIIVGTFIIYLVQATYFHLANKVTTGADIGFGQWFAFTSWTAFVGVFSTLISLVVLLSADNNQIAAESLDVTSLNALLLHAEPGDPWFRWASSFRLISLWSIALMAIGYARWTGASMLKSALIAVLPTIAIFGIWALMV
jgi:hypothetical protein